MNEIDTGGPAFPNVSIKTEHGIEVWGDSGMHLRDYFAAKAMQADMADGIHESDFAWSAARSYKMADAMLKARKQ